MPTDIYWILQIEGHTDNLPVKEGQTYKDNWELSTKRALSVLRFLIKQGINPNRLSASGYGSFQPIDINNNALDIELAKSVGPYFQLNANEMNEIINELISVVRTWEVEAKAIGISRAEISLMRPAFNVE